MIKFWTIYWLPLAMPLLAVIVATLLGLAWTYLVEDRQRRVLLGFLSQFVSPEVARELDRRSAISLGGVRRELSLLFSDIAGFTDLSEQMTPDQLEKFMNFYLSEMSNIVFTNNGTLDKYIGDAIMSFWNAPLDQADHAARACRTALGIHQREEAIRPILTQLGAAGIHTRIGINTGQANVGNYGSLQKLNYTVLGDNVNLASRLEGANKIYGSHILVAQPTVEMVRDKFVFRQLDLLRVKGKKKPMAVYELLAERNGDSRPNKLVKEFEAAFAYYQQRKWDDAERILVDLLQGFPEDGPSKSLLKRVQDYRTSPPPADWDGVYVAKDK
jgi:adenylate cyclase